jgi:hypothetical protein
MPKYLVIMPIAGHISTEVEADSEDEAIELAKQNAKLEDVETWDILPSVNQGNVCNFPDPWEITVEEI